MLQVGFQTSRSTAHFPPAGPRAGAPTVQSQGRRLRRKLFGRSEMEKPSKGDVGTTVGCDSGSCASDRGKQGPVVGWSSAVNLPAARLKVRLSILALMFVLVTYGCCWRRRESDHSEGDLWASNGPQHAAAETAATISRFMADGTRLSCIVEGL